MLSPEQYKVWKEEVERQIKVASQRERDKTKIIKTVYDNISPARMVSLPEYARMLKELGFSPKCIAKSLLTKRLILTAPNIAVAILENLDIPKDKIRFFLEKTQKGAI